MKSLAEQIRLARRPVATVADQGFVSVVNFLTVFLFARSLSESDFGIVVLALTIFLAVTAVQTATVGQVHNVLGPRRSTEDYKALTGHLSLLHLGLSVIVAIIGLLTTAFLLISGSVRFAVIAGLTTLVLLPWLFQDTVRRFLYTNRRMSAILINDMSTYGLQGVGAVALVVGFIPATAEWALGIYAVACLAGTLVGIIQLRMGGWRLDRSIMRRDFLETWDIGKYLAGGEFLGIFGRNATSWMLAAFMGLPALGAYKASVHLANALNPLSIATTLYLPAMASEQWTRRSPVDYGSWYMKKTLLLSAGFGAIVLVLTVGAEPLLHLMYGDKFAAWPMALILQITLAGRLIVFVRDTLHQGMIGAGQSRVVMQDRILQLVLLALLGAPLIRAFGGVGAATWHTLTAVFLLAFALFRFWQLTRPGKMETSESAEPTAGAEAEITIEDGGTVIRKRYLSSDRAPSRAREEFRTLSLLHAAADRAPAGVSSPRPIALDADDHAVVMERCPGVLLSSYMKRTRPRSPEMDRIGQALSDGLRHVVETLEAPYHDFCPQNVLWDPDSGRLYVIDLSNKDVTEGFGREIDPYATSMGCWIGYIAYSAARPSQFGRFDAAARDAALFRRVARRARSQGIRWSRIEAFRIAAWRYRRMALSGGFARTAWYLTVGPWMALWTALRTIR